MRESGVTFSTLLTHFGQLIYISPSSIIEFEEAKCTVEWPIAENGIGEEECMCVCVCVGRGGTHSLRFTDLAQACNACYANERADA